MKAHLRMSLLLAGVVVLISDARVLAHTDLTVEQARDLIASTADLVVVDVREPSEYCDARGHIPGALNYPLTSGVLQARYAELPMDRPILVVCRSGGRSNVAANFLDAQGFPEVYDMNGGMNAWLWETVPCKYSGGSGTADDPYRIATAADLIALGETPEDYDKHFILTADIDLDPNLPGGKVFDKAVIGGWDSYFGGVFDGNGHRIMNMTISGIRCLGLFGRVRDGAEVCDLGLENVSVVGVTGWVQDGIVKHLVESKWVGGLAGYNSGSLTRCYSTGAVRGEESVGGLVGMNWRPITDCYSTASVRGSESWVGGLVGFNEDHVHRCYSTGAVSGGASAGGLVGITGGVGGSTGGTVAYCFWDTQTSGQLSSSGGIGKTTAEMQTAGTFLDAGWDFVDETENGTEDIWWIDEDKDYPRLWWEREAAEAEGVVELSAADFDAQIAEGVVLVDFYATWCSFCDMQAPILDKVAERLGGRARVAKLDVDEARDIMQRYDITGVPTLILFRDGLVVERFVGLTDADTLVAAVLSVVELQV